MAKFRIRASPAHPDKNLESAIITTKIVMARSMKAASQTTYRVQTPVNAFEAAGVNRRIGQTVGPGMPQYATSPGPAFPYFIAAVDASIKDP